MKYGLTQEKIAKKCDGELLHDRDGLVWFDEDKE